MIKKLLLSLIPRKWYLAYVNKKNSRYQKMDTRDVFSEIYEKRIWDTDKEKNDDFSSGSGTINPNTERYIGFLSDFVRSRGVKHLVEIGCGDFRVMKQVLESAHIERYTGIDIVPKLIERNERLFGSAKIGFKCLNAVTDALPIGDCLVIRQVLQHLSNEQIKAILDKATRFRYLLITEHIPVTCERPNLDKPQGPETRLNAFSGIFIEKAPFSLQNVETVFEYREDHSFMNRIIPSLLRTSLVTS